MRGRDSSLHLGFGSRSCALIGCVLCITGDFHLDGAAVRFGFLCDSSLGFYSFSWPEVALSNENRPV